MGIHIPSSISQETDSLFKYVTKSNLNLTSNQSDKLDTILDNVFYANHYFVEVNDITAIQDSGDIAVNLPNKDSFEIYDGKDIEFDSISNYTYYGELIECDDRSGYIHLIAKNGNIYGQIDLGREVFELQDLGGGKNVLIELDTSTIYSEPECVFPDSIDNDSLANNKNVSKRSHSHCPVRVLILFTEAAENAVADIQDRANLLARQTTQAAKNSDADVNFQFVGVEELDGFTEDVDLSSRASTAKSFEDTHGAMFNNNDINTARDDAQADIVVLLTDGNWQFGGAVWLGLALNNDYDNFTNPNAAFAMVEADGGGFNYVFAHEVGHIFGCKHEGDDYDDPPWVFEAQGHIFYTGWIFNTYRKITILTEADDLNGGERILNFSNPNVEYKNKSTGVVDARENAQQISNLACDISEYEDFTPDFSTYITGPRSGDNSGTYTWCVESVSCNNITDIEWEYSYDGFNYSPIQSSNSCIQRSLPLNKSVYFRVTVTCGGSETSTSFIYVHNTDSEFDCSSAGKSTKTDNGSKLENIHINPNPALNELNVTFKTNLYAGYEVINSTGKVLLVKDFNSPMHAGSTINIDISDLPSGYYTLLMKSQTDVISKPFIKL